MALDGDAIADAEDDDFPTIPGYEITGVLGKGGMGCVYRGSQISLGRDVAIKLAASAKSTSAIAMLDERFEREARSLAKLNHPNIVAVYDYVRLEDGAAALIMELVEGGTLQQLLDERGPLSADEAQRFLQQIGAGLAAAHKAGVIHRDLKAANVLIAPNGVAKVSDFGLAAPAHSDEEGSRLTLSGMAMGTPGTMSPEQTAGSVVDHRTDIFSLGALGYQILTGKLPQGNFDPPPVSGKLRAAILQALRTNPEDRFQSVAEFLTALTNEAEQKTNPRRRKFLVAAAKAAVISAAAVGGFKSLPRPKTSDWVSLLEDSNATPGPIFGNVWHRDGEAVVAVPRSASRPLSWGVRESWPHDEFELRLRFQRLSGGKAISLFFPCGSGFGNFEFCPWGELEAGFQWLDGDAIGEQSSDTKLAVRLRNQTSYELIVQVSPTRLFANFNDDQVLEIDMDGRTLSLESPWIDEPWNGFSGIALGCWGTGVRFESLDWKQPS